MVKRTKHKPVRRRRKFKVLDSLSVEQAGAQIGLSRAEAYRAASVGDIPTFREGRFLRVPRVQWNVIRRRLARAEARAA
jgi:hypothetical protein